ncbi:rhodanese-like domain-containing protein [Gelidibacter maritimus]|uniref:Rhodanese-like domain-containing protein n=1 Tax=Gelidibacter maritimus TaxID=2761487 RepID=A0A7W2M786_9FLAO|nr:rhodanese-like domain-containing protein [Gelidibacter maritimus]MBA6154014.1 rhodanese-like domain-containing protein [Gelidibacter maritimus]
MNRFLLIFIVGFTFFTACKEKVEGEVNLVTVEEMQSLMELEDVQLVDVRTAKEREDGYIKNSQNIDYYSPTFDEDILKLDKTKPVIIYCRSGKRSADCAEKMIEAGFVKVYDLKGGITQWLYEDRAIELVN